MENRNAEKMGGKNDLCLVVSNTFQESEDFSIDLPGVLEHQVMAGVFNNEQL